MDQTVVLGSNIIYLTFTCDYFIILKLAVILPRVTRHYRHQPPLPVVELNLTNGVLTMMTKIYLTLAMLGIVAALATTAANAGTCYTTCNTMTCTTVCEP